MIIIDENVCNGKPIVAGTRITVDTVVATIDWTMDERLVEYPSLTEQDVIDCFNFWRNQQNSK